MSNDSNKTEKTKETRRPASLPEFARLKVLRGQRALPQQEVEKRLEKKRSYISRTEAVKTVSLISTYQQLAQALGGRLVVKIVYPNGELEVSLDRSPQP